MRLFIAIPLPDEIKDLAQELQAQLTIGHLSIIAPKDLHLTLLFLGEIETTKVDTLVEKLKALQFSKFTLKTQSINLFGNKEYYRVVFWDLKENELLSNLAHNIDVALKSFKIKRDYPFKAHITLARVKHLIKNEKKQLKEKIEAMNVSPKEVSFGVDHFILFETVFLKNGLHYEAIKKFYSVNSSENKE